MVQYLQWLNSCYILCLLIWQAAFYIHTIKGENSVSEWLQLSYTVSNNCSHLMLCGLSVHPNLFLL